MYRALEWTCALAHQITRSNHSLSFIMHHSKGVGEGGVLITQIVLPALPPTSSTHRKGHTFQLPAPSLLPDFVPCVCSTYHMTWIVTSQNLSSAPSYYFCLSLYQVPLAEPVISSHEPLPRVGKSHRVMIYQEKDVVDSSCL